MPGSENSIATVPVKTSSKSKGTITTTSDQQPKDSIKAFFEKIATGIIIEITYPTAPILFNPDLIRISVWMINSNLQKLFDDLYKRNSLTPDVYTLESNQYTDDHSLTDAMSAYKDSPSIADMMKAIGAYFRSRGTIIHFHPKLI
ncbi:MAG: hypothetical protein QM802_18420 [Agriterribacter sp.]